MIPCVASGTYALVNGHELMLNQNDKQLSIQGVVDGK